VVVAYERCSPTRDSNYSDLTDKILVVWKSGLEGGHLRVKGGRIESIKERTTGHTLIFVPFTNSKVSILLDSGLIDKRYHKIVLLKAFIRTNCTLGVQPQTQVTNVIYSF